MLAGIYVAAVVILLASLVVGRALLGLFGKRDAPWLAPAAGFAVLMIACRLAVRLPGRATTSALMLAALVLAAAGYLAASRRPLAIHGSGVGVPFVLAVGLLAGMAIPFLASGVVGVLGVGRQSDLQAHIYAAQFLTDHIGLRPDAIGNGYPLGPHAVVASVAKLTGGNIEAGFIGLIVVVPVLTAWTALAALKELPALRRIAIAGIVGLSYLVVSFLAEGAFKEPLQALYVLAFALALSDLDLSPRRAAGAPGTGNAAMVIALIALAGASVYTYSYPGLAWLALTAVLWGAIEALRGELRLSSLPRPSRRILLFAGLAGLILIAIAIPEARRIADFRHTVSFVEDTTGRLKNPVSPGQALGLWPSGIFRVDPGNATLATVLATAALLGLTYGLTWWARRREFAVPAALLAGALIYADSKLRSGLYIELKALVVLAPLPMLVTLRALLAPPGRAKAVLGGAMCLIAAACSFMVLRDAPVGPRTHGDELAKLRPYLDGKNGGGLLFLSWDRLSSYELRGIPVRQGYIVVKRYNRSTKHWEENDAIDFDSIPDRRLNHLAYVVTTKAAFASQPPPNFKAVASTPSFILWKREGETPAQQTLPEARTIGAPLDCSRPPGSGIAGRSGGAGVIAPPVVGPVTKWSSSRFFAAGDSVSQTLKLPKGRWNLSLQYNSPVPLTISGPGIHKVLSASYDGKIPTFEGTGPFWAAGSTPGGGPVRITVSAKGLNGIQHLLGVTRRIALGEIAATSARPEQIVPLQRACGHFVDWYELGG